jgi:hypothetical protein
MQHLPRTYLPMELPVRLPLVTFAQPLTQILSVAVDCGDITYTRDAGRGKAGESVGGGENGTEVGT